MGLALKWFKINQKSNLREVNAIHLLTFCIFL